MRELRENHQPHGHFGLGSAGKIDTVEVRWPSGKVEKVAVPLNRITTIRESK